MNMNDDDKNSLAERGRITAKSPQHRETPNTIAN